MSYRFFPDLIVATKVRSFFLKNAYFNGYLRDDIISKDDIIKILGTIWISPKACVECQEDFRDGTLSNVFVGYGTSSWTEKDYREYFEVLSKRRFELKDRNLDSYYVYFFTMPPKTIGFPKKELTVSEAIQVICHQLLIQGVYGGRVLKKYSFLIHEDLLGCELEYET